MKYVDLSSSSTSEVLGQEKKQQKKTADSMWLQKLHLESFVSWWIKNFYHLVSSINWLDGFTGQRNPWEFLSANPDITQ